MNTNIHHVNKIQIKKGYLETSEVNTIKVTICSAGYPDFDLTLFTENAEPVEIEYDKIYTSVMSMTSVVLGKL